MGNIAKYRKRKVALLTAAVVASAWTPTAWALPSGEHNEVNVKSINRSNSKVSSSPISNIPIIGGIAGAIGSVFPDTMEVTLNGKRAAIDWKSFSIANGERVDFKAPGFDKWMVLNRVTGNEQSAIDGILNGHGGSIFLVNPHGILFGANARVDVGSLVATTMNIDRDEFLKESNNKFLFTKNGNEKITINKGADITARDGYVAIFAHEINNEGTITAPEVAMAGGKSVELSYDNKINLVVNVSNDSKIATVDTKNNYVLISAKDASNIIGDSIINNSGTINAAKGITKDEAGNLILSGDGGKIDMVAARVLVNGELNADGDKGGTITTSGYEVMQVNDGSKVHAASKAGEAGTWNVIGKNATIDSGVTGTDLSNDNNGVTKGVNKISNTVVSNSLVNTNVSVEASPDKETYYSDVRVNKAVEKTSGDKTTTLTLTAGRNVIVEDDIKSSAGALNVKLNSDVKKHTENDAAEDNTQDEITNSGRTDGANIIKADIETNGGDFTTTGELGTYFGMKEVAQAGSDAKRYVKTNGGNISLGGDEVLVATGGTVELDTTTAEGKNGTVTIEGSVNSANAYQSKHESKQLSWSEATQNAKAVSEKSHLAVITGALEDAVATSTINTDFSDTAEAFIGGHVVAVAMKQDADGNYYPVDANGNFITMTDGVLSADPVKVMDGDKVKILDGNSYNTYGNIANNKSGWYNLKNGGHARFWGWTEGEEKGTIFYVQTVGEVIENHDGNNDTAWQSKSHGYALNDKFGREYYTNFAPGEPNDDMGQTGQTALAVNYDTYKSNQRKDLLYSKWDDINDYKSGTNMTYYVVETDLGHTSLNIKADDTLIKGSVGNTNKLNNLDIDSTGSVTVNGSVQVDNHVDAKAQTDATFHDFIDAEKDYVKLEAINGSVTADGAVKAGTDITMAAGNNVTAGDIVKAGRDVTMDAKGNVLAKGDVTAVGNVDMKAVGNVTAEKNITAGQYVHAVATEGDITTNGAVLAKALDVNLDAQKGSVTTSGTVTATKDNVTLTAGKDVNVNAAVTAGKEMSAHAGNNVTTAEAGAIKAENGSIELVATNNNVNVNGAVTIGQNFTAQAGQNATINVAVNAANGEVFMKAGETLTATDVTAGKNVTAEGNNVTTTGKVEAKGGSVTMTATNELKAVNVTATTDVTGSGKDINITGAVNATQGAANLTAENDLVAKDVTAGTEAVLNAGSYLTAHKIEAGKDVNVKTTSGNVKTTGAVTSDNGNVSMTAGYDLNIEDTVNAKSESGTVNLEAGHNVATKKAVKAGGDVTLDADKDINADGAIESVNGKVSLTADGHVDTKGAVTGTEVDVQAGDYISADGDVTSRNGAVTMTSDHSFVSATGTVEASGGDASLTSKANGHVKANNVNVKGGKAVLKADGDFVNAEVGYVHAGNVHADQDVTLEAASEIYASGAIESAEGKVSMTAGDSINVSEKGSVTAGTEVDAHASQNIYARGNVKANNGAVKMLADKGEIGARGKVEANGGNALLEATHGAVNADDVNVKGGEAVLKAEGGTLNAGNVQADQDVTLHAAKDINTTGAIKSENGKVSMTADGHVQAEKAVTAGTEVDAHAGDYLSAAGDVTSNNGAVTLVSDNSKVITTGAITAKGGKVTMDAKNGDVTAAKAVTADKDVSVHASQSVKMSDAVDAKDGSVFLVADKASVTAENKVSASESVIAIAGTDIKTKEIDAGQDVLAQAGASIETDGLVKTDKGAITMVAQYGNVKSQNVEAGGDIAQLISVKGNVEAGDVKSNKGEVLLKSEKHHVTAGKVKAQSKVTISAGTNATTNGTVIAEQGEVYVEAGSNINANDVVNAQNSKVFMGAGKDLRAKNVYAKDEVVLNAGNKVRAHDVKVGKNVTATGDDINISGDVYAKQGKATLNAGTKLNAVNVYAGTDVTATGENIVTTGKVTASAGTVNMDADKDLRANDVYAGTDAELTAGNKLRAHDVKVGENVTATGDDIWLKGDVFAKNGEVTLTAGTKLTTGTKLADDTEWTAGNVYAGTDVTATGENIETTGKVTASAGTVSMNAEEDLRANDVYAGTDAELMAGNKLRAHDVKVGENVKATGDDIWLKGDVFAKNGEVTLSAGTKLTTGTKLTDDTEWTAGNVYAGTDVTATGENINTNGAVTAHEGTVSMKAKTDLRAHNVYAGQDAVLEAGNKVRVNDVKVDGNVTATGADVKTTGDVIAKNGEVSMEATTGNVTAEGEIKAAKAVSLKAGNDVNTKAVTVHKEERRLLTANAMMRNVAPAASGAVKLEAGNNVHTEAVTADTDVTAHAGNSVTVSGDVTAKNGSVILVADEQNVKAEGKIDAAVSTVLLAGNDVETKDIKAGQDVRVQVGNAIKTASVTAEKGTVNLIADGGNVESQNVTAGGSIAQLVAIKGDVKADDVKAENGEVMLKAELGNVESGSVTAANALNMAAGRNVTAKGAVESVEGKVSMTAGENVTAEKTVTAGTEIYAHAGNDVNTTGLVEAKSNAVTLVADKGNVNAGDVKAEGDVNLIAANGSVNTAGIEAADDVNAIASKDITTTGEVTAVNNVKLKSGHDISTADVTANQKVRMDAGNDVTINGYISGLAQNAEDAVDIRAKERFLNKLDAAGKASNAAIKVGEDSHWKVYSNTPYADDFGGGVNSDGLNSSDKDLNSGNYAVWGWDGTSTTSEVGNRYIFKNPRPTMTIKANNATKEASEDWTGKNTGYIMSNSFSGQFMTAVLDGDDEKLVSREGYTQVGTYSDGFKPNSYKAGVYEGDITLTNTEGAAPSGFNLELLPGTLTVVESAPGPNPPTPTPPAPTPDSDVTPDNPQENSLLNPGEKPQLDALNTSNLAGTASITEAQRAQASVDRVLGLQSAELPFFNKKNGHVKFYGTYDVTVDPDSVKMEPTAKVLPEPDQLKNQYREYDKELTTAAGTAKFRLTYNGTTLDIYPTDAASMAILTAGDGNKNVEVESQALFAAFNEMGITLDDLDGVYTHFEKA